LDPVTEIELLQDVSDVRLRSVLADDESCGDLLIRETSGSPGELLNEAAGDGRGERGAAVSGDADWGDQLVLGRGLEQEAARSRPQRVYTYSSRSNVVEPLQDNRLARPGNLSGRRPSNKA
jgi:hypothetical protein